MVTAIEISNATDKKNAPERTKTYQTIISKYSDAEQEKFAELLADQIDRPMGKPTLVDESDKREPYNSAAADFGGV